jgi:hypothetical protein
MARATLRRAAAWWRRQLDDAAPGARRALAIILGAGAVAAAVAAILGLVFMFVPGLGPEQRVTGTITVPLGGSVDLELTAPRLTMMTHGAFLTREKIPPDGFDANQLARRGVAVDFDATAAGFDDLMTLPVVLTLFKQDDDDLEVISSLVGQVDLTGGIGLCGCAEWVDVPRVKAEFLVEIGVVSPETQKKFRRVYSEPFFGLA